jgi:hypothetical protein
VVEKPRDRWIWGRAMFTMVTSRTTMSWDAAMTASATAGWWPRRAALGDRDANSGLETMLSTLSLRWLVLLGVDRCRRR